MNTMKLASSCLVALCVATLSALGQGCQKQGASATASTVKDASDDDPTEYQALLEPVQETLDEVDSAVAQLAQAVPGSPEDSSAPTSLALDDGSDTSTDLTPSQIEGLLGTAAQDLEAAEADLGDSVPGFALAGYPVVNPQRLPNDLTTLLQLQAQLQSALLTIQSMINSSSGTTKLPNPFAGPTSRCGCGVDTTKTFCMVYRGQQAVAWTPLEYGLTCGRASINDFCTGVLASYMQSNACR